MPNLLTVAKYQIIIEVMPISTRSHHGERVVFLDNMIIWNDKLEGDFWGMNLYYKPATLCFFGKVFIEPSMQKKYLATDSH